MRLYHHTPHAEEILRDGFRDDRGYYLVGHRLWFGVWLEDTPGGRVDGAGWQVIAVDIPESAVADYELRELEKRLPFREFLVPAGIVNRHGSPRPLPPPG
jgi:hypothetical protein